MTATLRWAGSNVFLLVAIGLWAAGAGAQDEASRSEREAPRPVDTSSPRATLQSFLTNLDLAVTLRRGGGVGADRTLEVFNRGLRTLDFSATPDGNSWVVRGRRTTLLHEVLGRIALPPESEIPDADEVAETGISRWMIPGTKIAFERIASGPAAGEWLFSADTLERIDRVYRRLRHLPYRADATPAIYEEILRTGMAFLEGAEVRARLQPVETSSPRATFEGFVDSVNRAHTLVMEADAALRAEPPTMTVEEARELERRARQLLDRAQVALDLSHVPAALRQDVGVEDVLLLKEILDRMLPPPLDALPNEIMVAAARAGESSPFLPGAAPLRWRLPNTEIEIVEIVEGERQGEFLFSAGSVARLPEYYERVLDLPYRRAELEITAREYRSPHLSPGFYEYYISTPGYLVPRIHFLGRIIDDLPPSFRVLYADQALWQWVGMLLCVLLTAGVSIAVFWLVRSLAGRLANPADDWLRVAAPAIVAVLVTRADDFIDTDLNFTGDALSAVTSLGSLVFAVMLVWAAIRLCLAVAETIIASPRIRDVSIDASLVRVAARIAGFLIGAWIFVWSVGNLGVDVVPLIAGLGVGGLAVALAAQRTFANFIGSLILYLNRPVAVGDFCLYGDGQIGTVEEIGLLSTRVRTLERTVVTVPNADFSEMQLENFARRDRRLLKTVLQLRYETTPEQMRYIVVKLRELLLGHPKVLPDPARVRFTALGEYSLDVEIFAYLDCQDQSEYLAIKEDLLLRMMEVVTEAGTGFAFPSTVEYHADDAGMDAERGKSAEAQVAAWRAGGKLPFPEFADEDRKQLEDVLDYPPKGSPGSAQR